MDKASADIEMGPCVTNDSVLNQLQLRAKSNSLNSTSTISRRDRHFSVQSLTIMNNDHEITKSLLELSDDKKSLQRFFALTGNYWPTDGVFILTRLNFVVSKLAVLLCAGLLAFITAINIKYYAQADDSEYDRFYELYIALDAMLFLNTLSVLPAQYFNRLRMRVPAEKEDFMVIDECLRVAYVFGLVSGLCVVGGVALESLLTQSLYLSTSISSLFVVMSLMFNMFFLVLDLKVSLLLIDQLHILADRKLLTIDKFNLVRAEVHRRVRASKLASDFVIIPSVASAVGIIISVVLVRQEQKVYSDDDGYSTKMYMGLVFIQLKELFYLALAFWFVAKVNGRADDLTAKLSEEFWGEYQNANNIISYDSSDSEPQEKVDLTDLHRMSIYMSGTSHPISFTLLFKRLSWNDVLVSGVGFSVTLLFSFLKSFVKDANL